METPIQLPIDPSSPFKYPDQPTATVATANKYSRMRFQPMNHATISPSVAYEYE